MPAVGIQPKLGIPAEALIEMYLAGVSVHRVADITQALWGSKVSPSTISDDERAGESVSIENQREMLVRYVKEQGWNLYQTYVDDGISGTTFDRPSLNRMIADATDKKINLILCKDLSRFGRDYIEVGRYTDYPRRREPPSRAGTLDTGFI